MCKLNQIIKNYSYEDILTYVDEKVELIKSHSLTEDEKNHFLDFFKEILLQKDNLSVSCVGFLRDIMSPEIYDFLLKELKGVIFSNDALSIEIIKLLDCCDNNDYKKFLLDIVDSNKLNANMKSFLSKLLSFHQNQESYFCFPEVYQGRTGDILNIVW